MTVSTAYAPIVTPGNGVTTSIPVTWPFFTGSLVVTHIAANGTETVYSTPTHYSVSGGTDANGLPATGTVTLVTAHATGTSIRTARVTPRTQAVTWSENDNFPEKVVEAGFDKQLLLAQEAIYTAENPDQVDVTFAIGTVTTGAPGSSASAGVVESPEGTFTLSLTIPRGDTGTSGPGTGDVIGPASATADAISLFNGTTGKLIKDSGYTITAAGAAILDDASASVQRTTLGLGSVATQGDGDKGDITVSASGATWTIDNDVVTYAKMQNVSATSRWLGRYTAGAGDTEEGTFGPMLSLSGSQLRAVTVSGTAVSASGTSVDFTSIPDYVKRIDVMLSGVGTNGTSAVGVQLGDSGGIETSGYSGGLFDFGGAINFSTGFFDNTASAAAIRHFVYRLHLIDGSTNTWVCSVAGGLGNTSDGRAGCGSKSLTGTLDRIRVTTAGGVNTFNAGTINILYG